MTDTISGQLFSVCYRWRHASTQADNFILRLKVIVGGISDCGSEKTGTSHCHRDIMEGTATQSEMNEYMFIRNLKKNQQKTEMAHIKGQHCARVIGLF